MSPQISQSEVTTNHETIKEWVEGRNGKPARVKGTEKDDSSGILRIDFPDGTEENLESISWEEFFKAFDENNLAFLYQTEDNAGNNSRFNKFIDRDSV